MDRAHRVVLPPHRGADGSPAWWSPDGRALLVTTLDNKDTGAFTAHRYDLATGRIRQTPITLDCEICIAGWAADSVRYVVMLRNPDPEVLEGPIQYLHPDGTPGGLIGARGIIPDGDAYSPTRRYVILEPARPVMDAPPPAVFDLRTRTVVGTVDTAWPLIGWYDERRVVRVAPAADGEPTVLEVVDVRTGAVHTRVPATGLVPYRLQLGPAGGLDVGF